MNKHIDDDEDAVREYFLRVRIRMTRAEEATLRADQRLGSGESTRTALATLAHEELLGLGLAGSWWHQVGVK